MKASLTNILYSALAAVALTACQSNTYKITGSAEGLQDGDTLFITSDLQTGYPSDTLVIKDGKFQTEGKVDSVHLCMIYCASRNEVNAPFFAEAGNIQIKLSEKPGATRISGTLCNDEWQKMNDEVMTIGKDINRIAERIYGEQVSAEEQQKGMEQIEKLNQRFSEMVVQSTERNINNELGYFLLNYYPEDIIDNDTKSRLIEKLPAEMRDRQSIKQLMAQIAKAKQTVEGATMADFKMNTPEGTPVSALEEISKYRITVIDFWASWCGPCREEMPFMIALYDKYKDQGMNILGVSLDSTHEAWINAINQFKMPWTQVSDLKGWDNAAAQQFNIQSIPHTIVVDANGKILRRGLRGKELEDFIAEQF